MQNKNSASGPNIQMTNEKIYLNIKVKLSLCLTKHYAMKTYGGVEV
jgi:hypothetical protein